LRAIERDYALGIKAQAGQEAGKDKREHIEGRKDQGRAAR
jgi:hypothetical protein